VSARRRLGVVAAAMAGAVVSLATLAARADMTKTQCVEANGKAQDLAHDGKLTAARALLQSCAVPACPAIVRDDCAKRLDALNKTQPTIIFEAKDASGGDLSAVAVTVDGVPLADKLDGTPLRVDPGEHVFVFTAAGQAPVTQKLVVVERDHARKERVAMTALTPAPTPSPPPAAPPAAPPAPAADVGRSGGMSTLRLLGLVSGGVGVAGLAAGGVFGVMTGSAWNSQKSDCASATNCAHHDQAVSDHATLTTDSTVATIGFVAGGALLAAGAVLFLVGGPGHVEPAASGLVVIPGIAPGGAGLSLHGAF